LQSENGTVVLELNEQRFQLLSLCGLPQERQTRPLHIPVPLFSIFKGSDIMNLSILQTRRQIPLNFTMLRRSWL
jgi:hypothetical protein